MAGVLIRRLALENSLAFSTQKMFFSMSAKPMNTAFKDFAKTLEASATSLPQQMTDTKITQRKMKPKAQRSKHDQFMIQVKQPLTFQGQLDKFLEGVNDDVTDELAKFDKTVEKTFLKHEEKTTKQMFDGGGSNCTAEIDWDAAMAVIEHAEQAMPAPKVDKAELQRTTAVLNPTFSLAKVIGECPTLQRLVDLGVDLSQWEKKGGLDDAGMALSLDFGRDVAPRLRFLVDHGVRPSNLGRLLTENPDIFRVQLSDMKVRVEYLTWRKFSVKSIAAILNSCPVWLNFSTADVDRRLGYFQRAFALSANQVRALTAAKPDFVIWDGVHMNVERVRVLLTNELEFDKDEAREILLRSPQVYQQWDEESVRETHSVVKQMYTNQVILHSPAILAVPKHDVRVRHLFLKFLGKAQYDPKKPNYVSPAVIAETSDEQFCLQAAKVPLDILNKFLLTV